MAPEFTFVCDALAKGTNARMEDIVASLGYLQNINDCLSDCLFDPQFANWFLVIAVRGALTGRALTDIEASAYFEHNASNFTIDLIYNRYNLGAKDDFDKWEKASGGTPFTVWADRKERIWGA